MKQFESLIRPKMMEVNKKDLELMKTRSIVNPIAPQLFLTIFTSFWAI